MPEAHLMMHVLSREEESSSDGNLQQQRLHPWLRPWLPSLTDTLKACYVSRIGVAK